MKTVCLNVFTMGNHKAVAMSTTCPGVQDPLDKWLMFHKKSFGLSWILEEPKEEPRNSRCQNINAIWSQNYGFLVCLVVLKDTVGHESWSLDDVSSYDRDVSVWLKEETGWFLIPWSIVILRIMPVNKADFEWPPTYAECYQNFFP